MVGGGISRRHGSQMFRLDDVNLHFLIAISYQDLRQEETVAGFVWFSRAPW